MTTGLRSRWHQVGMGGGHFGDVCSGAKLSGLMLSCFVFPLFHFRIHVAAGLRAGWRVCRFGPGCARPSDAGAAGEGGAACTPPQCGHAPRCAVQLPPAPPLRVPPLLFFCSGWQHTHVPFFFRSSPVGALHGTHTLLGGAAALPGSIPGRARVLACVWCRSAAGSNSRKGLCVEHACMFAWAAPLELRVPAGCTGWPALRHMHC